MDRQLAKRRKPVFAGHHDVENNGIEMTRFEMGVEVGSAGAGGNIDAVSAEEFGGKRADRGIVIDDQDACLLVQPRASAAFRFIPVLPIRRAGGNEALAGNELEKVR